MIRLTRLNNRSLVVNSELIKFIENAPDTVITLITGEKIVVRETAEDVIAKVLEYRRELRRVSAALPGPGGLFEPLEYPEYPWDPEASGEPEEPPEDEG
jgi:flagellar protein FlbD